MIEYSVNQGIKTGTFPVIRIKAFGLMLHFTTREGGTSKPPFDTLNLGYNTGDNEDNVRMNREKLTSALGLEEGRVARAGQVHSSRVVVVNDGGIVKDCDGLITGTSNLTLVISTADCYPLVIYSPSERVLAALHAGRKGAAGGIIGEAMKILTDSFRIDTDNTLALAGPGICRECYELGEEETGPFPERFIRRAGGTAHLDLESYCVDELIHSGLNRDNIYTSEYCTCCNRELFFSHRRDRGKTGRQWTLATMIPPL